MTPRAARFSIRSATRTTRLSTTWGRLSAQLARRRPLPAAATAAGSSQEPEPPEARAEATAAADSPRAGTLPAHPPTRPLSEYKGFRSIPQRPRMARSSLTTQPRGPIRQRPREAQGRQDPLDPPVPPGRRDQPARQVPPARMERQVPPVQQAQRDRQALQALPARRDRQDRRDRQAPA